MARSIIISAIFTIMAFTTATATDVLGPGSAGNRIEIAFRIFNGDYGFDSGLTVKEKTKLGCIAESYRHTLEKPNTTLSGEKGDRLAADECE